MLDKTINLLAAVTAVTLTCIAFSQLSHTKAAETSESKNSQYPYKEAITWDSEIRRSRTEVWMHVYGGAISQSGDERDASVKADNAVKAFDERRKAGFL